MKKKKKTPDIIILYMCTINETHMMYVFWDMKHDRPFAILGHFFPFYSTKNPKKINILKKWKKNLEISSF